MTFLSKIAANLPGPVRTLVRRSESNSFLNPLIRKVKNKLYQDTKTIQKGLGKDLFFDAGQGGRVGYILGEACLEEEEAMSRFLDQGKVFYDIGAYAGYLSLCGSRLVGEEGQVYAFEPLPHGITCIMKNIERNKLTNIQLIEAAVSVEPGEAQFLVQSSGSTRNKLRSTQIATGKGISDNAQAITVKVVSIDDLLASHRLRPPHFVKVDVEGEEINVLKGMLDTLRAYRPVLYVEVHWKNQPFSEFVRDHLEPLDYTVKTIRGDDLPEHELSLFHALAVPNMTALETEIKEAVKEDSHPIFIMGRQHCGNTMLASILGRDPAVFSMEGEGTFFEFWPRLESLEKAQRLDILIQTFDKGVRPHMSEEEQIALNAFITEQMEEPITAAEVYIRANQFLMKRRGRQRWAQKATSYIFQIDKILKVFPQAKLIFLIRNPFDLAASLKRRQFPGKIFQMVYGWNRGVTLALQYQQRYPQNFLLVKYEEMVQDPEGKVAQIFAFAGLEFTPEVMQIPHINRSDNPHHVVEKTQGLSGSQVFYFRDLLTPVEQSLIYRQTDRSLLGQLYPELQIEAVSLIGRLPQVGQFLISNFSDSAGLILQGLSQRPFYTLDRVIRRVLR